MYYNFSLCLYKYDTIDMVHECNIWIDYLLGLSSSDGLFLIILAEPQYHFGAFLTRFRLA